VTLPKTYLRDGETIFQEQVLGSGDRLCLSAENVRRERTGVHATISIAINDAVLAWSFINVERDDARVRLANSAHRLFSRPDKECWPNGHLKHGLDLFCRGLWVEHLDGFAAEALGADADSTPTFALTPYVQEGGGMIAFAPPGRGKSYLALLMAVSIDAGVCDIWPVKQQPVLFLNLERSRDSVGQRIRRINRCLNLEPGRKLLCLSARGKSLADVLPAAQHSIAKHGVGVVFLDSISRAGYGDLTENQPVNRIIDALNSLCPTWVALAHTPRADETHPYGGVHFEAGEDIGVQLLTERGPDDTLGVGLQVVKANDMALPPLSVLALEFDRGGLTSIYPARRGQFAEIEAGKRMGLADEVAEYLAQVGKATATEIARELGRNRANVALLFRTDQRFILVGKEGKEVYYGLRSGVPG
jgi:hypothetical protein